MKFNLKKLEILCCIFCFATATYGQNNQIKDPHFTKPYLVNVSDQTDKWIHVLKSPVAEGVIERIKPIGFADSLIYCKVKYVTTGSNNRGNCYIAQRITGLEQKKYRVVFWLNIHARNAYLTSEVRYYNASMANETGSLATQKIIQTASTSTDNYQIPGNWIRQSFDIDLTGVTDKERIKTIRFSLFPNCKNGSTQAKECEYYFSEPLIYEIGEGRQEYVTDYDMEHWERLESSVVPLDWTFFPGENACIKRAPGHRDSDYGIGVRTTEANDGSSIQSNDGVVAIPAENFILSFYARSQSEGGVIRAGFKSLYPDGTGAPEIKLTSEWCRYEIQFDVLAGDNKEPKADVLQFFFQTPNTYFIDACRIEPVTNNDGTSFDRNDDDHLRVYTSGRTLRVSGYAGQLEVFNDAGILCFNARIAAQGSPEFILDKAGVYVLRLISENRTSVTKVVLK